jgi:uncharacterized protein (DUF2267 family)
MTQSASGVDVFDRTLHKTNLWLKHLMQALSTEDRHFAYVALRATLHALRDRLTVEEVAQFGAQLPMLVRGMYYEGWDPTGKPLKIRHKDQFLARIAQEIRNGRNAHDPERLAAAVFTVVAEHVGSGEIENVKHILPADIRDLWP